MLRLSSLALALTLPLSTVQASEVALESARSLNPATIEADALNILQARFLSDAPAGTALDVTRIRVDSHGYGHVRVQQTFQGVPIFGAEAIAHFGPDGRLASLTGSLHPDVWVEPSARVQPEDAIAIAQLDDARPGDYTAPALADAQILIQDRIPHLTWRVQLRQEDGSQHTAMPVYFIDASDGSVVFHYDNLQTIESAGTALYSGSVSVTSSEYNGTFYLEDLDRGLGTFDLQNRPFIRTRITDADNSWSEADQEVAVAAHFAANQTYDYYRDTFGRDGIDGQGGPGFYLAADASTRLLSSRVHYGDDYNNAYWSGFYMTYGDGDGSSFSPLVSIDVGAHEFTHGVTQFEANLTYSGESGALNESMSDIFAALVEFYTYGESADWLIGEDCYTPGIEGDALRYMNDTHRAANWGYTADDDPDHYSERYTGSEDNGGVHINSGISNFAFYLLAEGGEHHLGGSMEGIGRDKAARIYYLALTEYMTSSTDFAGAREATIAAASELYGADSREANAVAQAWSLVGVDTAID